MAKDDMVGPARVSAIEAQRMKKIIKATGESVSDWIRRMINEEYTKIEAKEMSRIKVFALIGDNGSYLELSDGDYIDTVDGEASDFWQGFFDVRDEDVNVSDAIDYCNKTPDIEWDTYEGWLSWSHWDNEVLDIHEHVGA